MGAMAEPAPNTAEMFWDSRGKKEIDNNYKMLTHNIRFSLLLERKISIFEALSRHI